MDPFTRTWHYEKIMRAEYFSQELERRSVCPYKMCFVAWRGEQSLEPLPTRWWMMLVAALTWGCVHIHIHRWLHNSCTSLFYNCRRYLLCRLKCAKWAQHRRWAGNTSNPSFILSTWRVCSLSMCVFTVPLMAIINHINLAQDRNALRKRELWAFGWRNRLASTKGWCRSVKWFEHSHLRRQRGHCLGVVHLWRLRMCRIGLDFVLSDHFLAIDLIITYMCDLFWIFWRSYRESKLTRFLQVIIIFIGYIVLLIC